MSKRHRKAKLMFSDTAILAFADFGGYGAQAPRGRRPKGRHRRENIKKAYYD